MKYNYQRGDIKMQIDHEIGERISKLRVERGWSQTRLARKMGTNVRSIQDWENGTSLPSVINIRKLCKIFSTTTDYLLNMDQVPTIRISGMTEKDIKRARAIIQVLVDTADET